MPENMPDRSLTPEMSHPEMSRDSNEERPPNMPERSSTPARFMSDRPREVMAAGVERAWRSSLAVCAVQPERFSEVSDVHPSNMSERSADGETSQPERSRDVSDEQPSNILQRLVAFGMSQPETSRVVSDEQPWNICEKSCTPETSQPERSSEVRPVIWSNRPWRLVSPLKSAFETSRVFRPLRDSGSRTPRMELTV